MHATSKTQSADTPGAGRRSVEAADRPSRSQLVRSAWAAAVTVVFAGVKYLKLNTCAKFLHEFATSEAFCD
jgi:hypothetical protein